MKSFCPAAFQFAVIRLDPVVMVEHFDDPIATAEARALGTKKYLVYLDTGVDMPFPTNRWFRFEVRLIGTTLHPEDPANGITSDMVLPIFPNTNHPSGRTTIDPEDSFPFSNCYFWLAGTVEVRIRNKGDMYDNSRAVKLWPMDHVAIELGFSGDFRRVHRFWKSQQAAAPAHNSHHSHDDGLAVEPKRRVPIPALMPQSTLSSPGSRFAGRSCGRQSSGDNATLAPGSGVASTTCSDSSQHNTKYHPEIEAILGMDIFMLAHDDAAEFIPLVDLWFELTEHLTADSIPSPQEFFKERDTIARIIRDARARSPHVPTPLRNEDGLSIMSDISSNHDNEGSLLERWELSSAQQHLDDSNDAMSQAATVTLAPASRNLKGTQPEAPSLCQKPQIRLPRRFSAVNVTYRVCSISQRPWLVRLPFLPYWP
ncbi:hypothetical protein FKP32DRAFT_265828 [Trametes sanguinea]|nr:hypothetical protein FKP32DRAFT_265828 [Trametes sanguinea]